MAVTLIVIFYSPNPKYVKGASMFTCFPLGENEGQTVLGYHRSSPSTRFGSNDRFKSFLITAENMWKGLAMDSSNTGLICDQVAVFDLPTGVSSLHTQ